VDRRTYQTLAPELEEYADRVAQHFQDHGYRIQFEKKDLGFPYTPTLVAMRERTTLILEVDSSIKHLRLEAWARYGKSCGHDLRVIVCLPDHIQVASKSRTTSL